MSELTIQNLVAEEHFWARISAAMTDTNNWNNKQKWTNFKFSNQQFLGLQAANYLST